MSNENGGGERGFMVQFDIIMVAVAFTIASSFTTNFVSFFGSYAPFILIYGVLAIIANLVLFKTSEEKYVVETEEKRPITKDLAIIIGHHPKLITLLIVWCLASIGYGIMFSSSVYYIMYYLMRPDLITVYTLIISIGALRCLLRHPVLRRQQEPAAAVCGFIPCHMLRCDGTGSD